MTFLLVVGTSCSSSGTQIPVSRSQIKRMRELFKI
jgi:hypothetical protein